MTHALAHPGARGQVQVCDWDCFGPGELNGSTFIGLEDRWFSARWQALDPAKRPVEARLWAPTSLFPQGTLSMAVEMHGHEGTGLEGTGAREHGGMRERGHEGTRAREHEGTRARGHESTGAQGSRARGHKGTGAQGPEDLGA